MVDMIFEIGGTVFGLIQGVLVMLNKRSNWIFYVLEMLFLIGFSVFNHLYGDIANNSIYLVMGVVGFILWKKADTSKITSCNLLEKIIYVIIMVLGTIILYKILGNTDDPLPVLDSFTTVSSLVATYYMMKKKIDTWVIWFVNDIFYAVEYFLLPDQALYLFMLNIIWTFMAVASYVNWMKIMKGYGKND
jgi:nicotinamide mononucleotide transporter